MPGPTPITDEVNALPPGNRLGKGLAKIFGAESPITQGANALRATIDMASIYTVQPLWHAPSYWAKPVTATRTRLVQPGATFTNFLTFQADAQNAAVIKQYVATVEGSAALANINFRIVVGESVQDIQFVLGQEKCRTGPNNYPAVPHPTHLISHGFPIIIQVQNLGAIAIRAFCALYGWTLPLYSIYGTGERSGTVDNSDG